MGKQIHLVQQILNQMDKNGCDIRIQRLKDVENGHIIGKGSGDASWGEIVGGPFLPVIDHIATICL